MPAEVANPSITVVRTFEAPVADVFFAWTDAAKLKRWLAPAPCQVLEASADPRPGGRYRLVVVDPRGDHHTVSGEYREVVPGQRLVQTWNHEGKGPDGGDYPSLVTVEFREIGPRTTEVTVRQEGLLTVEDRAGNTEGWRLCLGNLAALLQAEAPARSS